MASDACWATFYCLLMGMHFTIRSCHHGFEQATLGGGDHCCGDCRRVRHRCDLASNQFGFTTYADGSAMPPALKTAESPLDEKDKEWKSRLTEEQYMVTRKKGTEPPFSGKYWNHKAIGVYTCVCCATPLFDSITRSLTRAPAGQAFINRSTTRKSKPRWISVCSRSGPRFSAEIARLILATSSTTGRSPPGSATASIRSHSTFKKTSSPPKVAQPVASLRSALPVLDRRNEQRDGDRA